MRRIVLFTMLSLVGVALFAIPHPPINIEEGYITGIVHDGQHLYATSYGYGIVRIDKTTGEATWYTQENESLPSNDLTTICIENGALWVGDNSGNVSSLLAPDPYSERLFGSGKKSAAVSFIRFDTSGRMFVSHYGDFKVLSDLSVVDEVSISSIFTEGYIWQMKPDSKGNMWISDYCVSGNHGLSCYTADGVLKYVFEGMAGLPFNDHLVRAMAVDAQDHIWFVSNQTLVDYDGDNFATFDLSRGAYDMDFDEFGRLWLINKNGILTCFENGVSQEFTCPIETSQWCCMDIDGHCIYIGTDKGLLRFCDGAFTQVELPQEHTGIENRGADAQNTPAKHATFYHPSGVVAKPHSRGIAIAEGKKTLCK